MKGRLKMNPTIKTNSVISLADQPIQITIDGLSPNTRIKVKASSTDYYCMNAPVTVGLKSVWESYAIFKSDSFGCVDLDKSIPLEGSYETANGMGLLTMMKPIRIMSEERSRQLSKVPFNNSYTVSLQAEVNGNAVCSTNIKRTFQSENTICIEIQEKELLGRFFTGKDRKPRPGVIVVSGSDGRIEKAQSIAQLFAEHGYSALAVSYFGLEGVSEDLSLVPLEYIENAIHWMQYEQSVEDDKIAIYGRSKGGELALLAATLFPQITGVIANTPSSYVMEGLTSKGRNSKKSSWRYEGKSFIYVRFRMSALLGYGLSRLFLHKGNLSDIYKRLIKNREIDKAQIPVEKINGPVLLLSSEKDEIWPSTIFCRMIMERLEQQQFAHKYNHQSYQKCGHYLNIACQSNPREQDIEFSIDTQDAWNTTIYFLDEWSNRSKSM